MPRLTNSRLRLAWYVLVGCVTLASVLPGFSLLDPQIGESVGHTWEAFLGYIALAALPLLAWKLRAAVALASGTAILSVALQVVHGLASGRGIDSHCTMINLLGVASGVLLGLNILTLRAGIKDRAISLADQPKSRLN